MNQILIIGDSRVKEYQSFDQTDKIYTLLEPAGYNVSHISISGATLEKIFIGIEKFINRHLVEDQILVVKVLAGICNITEKHGQSVSLRKNITADKILNEIKTVRRKVKDLHRKTIITFCAIPPVNLPVHKEYTSDGYISTSYRKQLEEETRDICKLVVDINYGIKGINKVTQRQITPQSVSIADQCLHRNKGKDTYRIVASALYDGIHPVTDISWKWFYMVYASVMKEVKQLEIVELKKQKLIEAIKEIESRLDLRNQRNKPVHCVAYAAFAQLLI